MRIDVVVDVMDAIAARTLRGRVALSGEAAIVFAFVLVFDDGFLGLDLLFVSILKVVALGVVVGGGDEGSLRVVGVGDVDVVCVEVVFVGVVAWRHDVAIECGGDVVERIATRVLVFGMDAVEEFVGIV